MMSIDLGPEAQGHFQELLYERLLEVHTAPGRVFTVNCWTADDTEFEFSTTNANLALALSEIGDHGRVCLAEVLRESFQRISSDKQRLLTVRFPNEEKPKIAMLVTMAVEDLCTVLHCSPVR